MTARQGIPGRTRAKPTGTLGSPGSTAAILIALTLVVPTAMFWMLTSPGTAHACKCSLPGSPTEEVQNHTAVFTGRALSVGHSFEPNQTELSPSDRTTVQFEVASVWKGDVQPVMSITTPPTGGSCGVAFAKGQDYLVYAHDSPHGDGGHAATICSRTSLLGEAAGDIQALGEGNPPGSGVGDAGNTAGAEMGTVILWTVLAAAVLATMAAGGVILHRHRHSG